MADWYYATGGKKTGPIKEAKLLTLFAKGKVPRDAWVWRDGMTEWLGATHVKPFSQQLWPAKAFIPPTPAQFAAKSVHNTEGEVVYEVRYGAGLRQIAALVVCLLLATFSITMAGSRRGLILDGIHFSPTGAKIFFFVLTAAMLLGAGVLFVTLVRGLLPPWTLKMTGEALILPRVLFFGSHTIPFSSISSITERIYRGRSFALVLHTSQGKRQVGSSYLRKRNYDEIKSRLMNPARYGGSRRLLPSQHPEVHVTRAVYRNPWRMSKWAAWACGLFFLAIGVFNLGIGLETGATPTTVSIARFDADPPANRNVIITGGKFDFPHSLKFILYHYQGDPNPTITYFVPLLDPARPANPRVMFKIPEPVLKSEENQIMPNELHVTRLTQGDLDAKVRDWMKDRLGPDVDNMIIVAYGKQEQLWYGLAIVGLGVGIILFRGVLSRSD